MSRLTQTRLFWRCFPGQSLAKLLYTTQHW